MKWILGLCLACGVAAAAAAQETHIAAVVNADIVTADDLTARLVMTMKSSGIPDNLQNRQRLAERVLRSLIDEKLQVQEAKRLNIKVTDDEVNQAIAGIEQRNNMPKGGLDEFLKQSGIPRHTLVDQITASIAWERLVRGRFAQEVQISEEELDLRMKEIMAEVGKPQSRVAEIFLAIDNPTQEEDVKHLAERLIDQIRGGARFSAVAQQFSQSPSAATGGDIGWVTPAQLGSPLGDAIEKMRPGEMSYPIHSAAGYYILYVMERRTLGAVSPDETQLSLVELVFPVLPAASGEERRHAEQQAEQISVSAKSCGEMHKIGRDRSAEITLATPEVKAGDLPSDLRKQILALKLGEASQPMPMPGGVGVVMVCERRDPPGGIPTRDQLLESIGRARLDQLARRYMRDLRRLAFIDIRG
jgi:peptidyl-prolyl cis-trans isomerase SurA